ncbi:adenylate/guanylate cyclase domain-containing protein [Ramlibacter pinisoli]|uniref:Guanylate cyclase domain-containing protein n=1 Tax=Ramlibacter pinisoli TaxID=2682844 RepID=A0A6N8J3B5_9BURK|nr:adenylate/guanylate cyclase domain-containing protein [Ramlibacter pinisoli]MVQ32753.1 hypothetical protein [Ramlibacter pinisoli]
MELHRKVILVLDTVESVRLMESDESGFIQRWRRFAHEARNLVVPTHGGRFHRSTGDGFLLAFDQATAAVHAAFDLLRRCGEGNRQLGAEPPLQLQVRIAAHAAHYIADEFDIYGSGVNLASRLLALAGPGEFVVSAALRDLLAGSGTRLKDLGMHRLRHLSRPTHAFRVLAAGPAAGPDAQPPSAAGYAGS